MKTLLTSASGCLTLRAMAKEALIYTRLSAALKNRLAIEAHNRGEAEAVIVREALAEYFARHSASALREEPAPYAASSTAAQAGRTGKRGTLPGILHRAGKRIRAARTPKPQQ